MPSLASGLGGYISEFLVSDDSTAYITVGPDATAYLDVAMSPSVTTSSPNILTSNSLVMNGAITDLNGMEYAYVYFEYGLTDAYGSITSSSTKTGTGTFSATISGLASGSTYHYRAVAYTDGTNYGNDYTITMPGSTSTSALYVGILSFTNNCTSSQTNIWSTENISTSGMISAGLLNSTATNCAIRTSAGLDVAFQPSVNSSYPWVIQIPEIEANTTIVQRLYTGGSIATGKQRYFPADEGLRTSDNSSMEPGDYGAFEVSGFLDTTAVTDNLTPSSSRITQSGLTTIGSGIPGLVDSDNNTYGLATGAANAGSYILIDYGNNTPEAITSWSCYAPTTTNATFNIQWSSDNSTFVNITNLDLTTEGWITATWSNDGPHRYWRLYKTNAAGGGGGITEMNMTGDSAALVVKEGSFAVYRGGTGNVTAQVYGTCNVSYGGLSPGDTVVRFEAMNYGSNAAINLIIDDVTVATSALSANITDNSASWLTFLNDAMPYVEYQKVYIDGSLVQHIEWEYDTDFSDLSGNSNNAIPSFRTLSNYSCVSANLTSYEPITEATASENISSEWPEMMGDEDIPELPDTTYTENSTPGFFFTPLVTAFWDITGLPSSFFWYNFAFFFIMGVSILVYYFFAANNKQALLFKAISTGAFIIFFALPGINIFGFYVFIYYALFAFGILIFSKDYGW